MMNRLVRQEIMLMLTGSGQSWISRIAGAAVILLTILMVMTGDSGANSIGLAFFVFLLSDLLIKGELPDIIYMLPGDVRGYIRARLRYAVILEVAIFAAGILLQFIYAAVSGTEESAPDINILFPFAAYVLYAVTKSVWLTYITYCYKPLQKEKCAQGNSLFLFLMINLIHEVFDNTPVMAAVKLALLCGFAAYAIYICSFVKKNMITMVCRNEG